MRTSRTVLLLGLCFWLLLSRTARANDEVTITQVDPSGFPQMQIYVSITDSSGSLVSGLTKDDFEITEDGAPVEEILDFAGAEEARPVDIVFVFDTTGSMGDEIWGVVETSIAFADKLRENNRNFQLGLVAFGDEIRAIYPRDGSLTADAEQFKQWVSELHADGGGDDAEIALDGLQQGTTMQFRPDTQKILILITDAPPHERGDGTPFSQVTLAELLPQLRDSGFSVYAVAYDHPYFRQVAAETRGKFYDLQHSPDFTGIIDEIGGIIAAQYKITYVSPRPAYDGTLRNISVKVGGKEGVDSYLETHLLNVESNPVAALIFGAGLMVALFLPLAVARRPRQRAALAPAVTDPTVPPAPPPANAPAATVTCAHCGNPLRPNARFCGKCGQPTTAPPVAQARCPQCGGPVQPGARFCSRCGHAYQ